MHSMENDESGNLRGDNLNQGTVNIEQRNIDHEIANLRNKYSELSDLNKKLSSRVEELELFLEVNFLLSQNLDRDETVDAIASFFKTRFPLDEYSLLLRSNSNREFTVLSSFGFPKEYPTTLIIKTDDPIWGPVLREKKLHYIAELTESHTTLAEIGHARSGSFLSLPLLSESNSVFGVINLVREKPGHFSSQDIYLFDKITRQISSIIDKTIIFHKAKELAYCDALTGIFNRRYFDQRYQREILRAKRYNRTLSVLMIDIDHFKIFNDTNGHLLGDLILKKVSSLLENNLRRADVLCRYGGEEFVVILPEIDLEHAEFVAGKLRKAILAETFKGEKNQPTGKLTISVGVACFPENGEKAEAVLDKADQCLYEAKNAGRNMVVAAR